MRTKACLECLAAVRERVDVPIVPMTYSSLLEVYGWERFAHGRAGRRCDEPDHRRPAGGGEAGAPARPARRADVDRRAASARRRPDRRMALPRHGDRNHRRPRRVCRPRCAGLAERARAAAGDIPLYAGFGISTPDDARAAAELTDGVVVGSRALEAAEDGPERAARLRSLVANRARLGLSLPSRSAVRRGNRVPASARSGEPRHALSRIQHLSAFANSE